MAKLPSIKRLLLEDFPSQKDWISPLLQAQNKFMDSVYQALDKQLTDTENGNAQIVKITVTEGKEPFQFKVNTKTKPEGAYVTNFVNVTGTSPPITAALFLDWEFVAATNQIKINKVYGLNSGEKYQLTIRVHTT